MVPASGEAKNADKPRAHRRVDLVLKPTALLTEQQAKRFGVELLPVPEEPTPEDRGLIGGQLRDSVAAHQPLIAFKQVFAFDVAFAARVRHIQATPVHGPHVIAHGRRHTAHGMPQRFYIEGPPAVASDDLVTKAARPYAWNGGRPLAVMREVIFRVVAMNSDDVTFALLNFPPVPGGDLDAPSLAARWKKGGDYRSAALKLARLGAGKCLVDDCWRATAESPQKARPRARKRHSPPRIRYCWDHSHTDGRPGAKSYAERQGRADQEAMRALLCAIGDVVGVSA